ncbi:MAG: Rne/Rng family ribonuclease [Vulcanimicrobiaceae bacterium]
MSTEILISSDPWENRVAILEDGELAELYIERDERVIGSIYKGKVHNVLPGMGAAFVDIGLGRNAFLYVDDINKQPLNIGDVEITHGHSGFTIGEKVKKGDDVLVQIVKEPRGLKGARISTNISLPGRYLILMPTGKYSGVSRKIESADERNRLKGVMKRIRPEGMATVVRTAAAGVSEAELIADLGVLIRMWHGILEMYKRAASPSLLHKDMNLVYKAARDFITADVDRVLIDDEDEYRKVREFLQLLGPQYLDRVEHYNSGRDLFEDFKVDDELQKLMKPKINLPSGGSIVIETTEALTVIDVNSGKFTGGKNLEDTIVKTNAEAAAEIARQVRLRDIGGIVVVDFIDMSSEASRNKIVKVLEDGLRRDRTRATIQSFSALGLLEFTRKRIGKDLGAQLRGSCPTCSGLGTVMSSQSVAIETFRRIGDDHRDGSGEVVVHAAPTVAAQMEFWFDEECLALAKEIGSEIHVRVDPMLHPEKARIDRVVAFKEDRSQVVRVGDEHEVELLSGRLPNVTSAAAVVNGHLIEVENAANNAGNTARIRVLDVDDKEDYVLAEMVSAVDAGAKKKRRRGGKRKVELTAAEQTKALRELAEEAAKQAQGRPPIGITTITPEEEAEDRSLAAEVRGERQAAAIIIAEGAAVAAEAVSAAPAGDAEARGGRRRRRRRRGRGGSGGANGVPQGNGRISPAPPAPPGAPNVDEEYDDEPIPTSVPPLSGTGMRSSGAGAPDGAGTSRRRRRRRRGRGGAGAAGAGVPPVSQDETRSSVPDRHIFRVGSSGAAEPTGTTAPREPSRAIAPLRRAKLPAVDAPPPSLRAAAEEPKAAKPARRRRAAASPRASGEIGATQIAALPPAEGAVSSTRRPRKKAAADSGSETAAEKPKRTTRVKKTAPPDDGTVKPAARKRSTAESKDGTATRSRAKTGTAAKTKA